MPNPRRYLSYKEATSIFNEQGLLDLLKEGTVKARGQSNNFYGFTNHPIDGSPVYLGDPVEIGMSAWREYKVETDTERTKTDLVCINEDHLAFENVEIFLESIPQNEISHTKNKGGRPPIYKWDTFYADLIVHFYENGIPDTCNQWIEKLRDELPYLLSLSNGGPDQATLNEKLNPLFKKIKSPGN